MNIVNYLINKNLVVFILFLFLTTCHSQKINFVSNPEFKFKEVYKQNFIGGQPGNAGFNVVMILEKPTNIIPDSLYFQNRVAAIEIRNNQWIARFKTSNRREIILSQNQDTNFNEYVPEKDNMPFNLLNNQAVLFYHINSTPYYYKIVGIKSKETLYFQ